MSPSHQWYGVVPGWLPFYALIAVALVLFTRRAIFLLRLMLTGKPAARWDKVPQRLVAVLVYVFGQARLLGREEAQKVAALIVEFHGHGNRSAHPLNQRQLRIRAALLHPVRAVETVADATDHPVGHGHVGAPAGCTGSVHHCPAPDHQVCGHDTPLRDCGHVITTRR